MVILRTAQKCLDARLPCLRPASQGYAQASKTVRMVSRRIRSNLLPRLRAETPFFMWCPNFPIQGTHSQELQSKHYGVQARRREGEAPGHRSRWAFFSSR